MATNSPDFDALRRRLSDARALMDSDDTGFQCFDSELLQEASHAIAVLQDRHSAMIHWMRGIAIEMIEATTPPPPGGQAGRATTISPADDNDVR